MAQMSVYESKDFDEFFAFEMEGYAEEVLKEGSKILEERMKSNARAAIKHDGDSEMINSIKASKPKKSKNGAYIINVGPRGYSKVKVYKSKKSSRTYSVSNALKAIWKEYGIPNKQPKQPFIAPTVTQTESQIYDLMQKRFEEKAKV